MYDATIITRPERPNEGREGQSQAGPKGHKLEVGARRAPKLLFFIKVFELINGVHTTQCTSSPPINGQNLS